MKGFFNKKETQSDSRPDGKVYSCVGCGLSSTTKNPKLQQGNFQKKILIVGECMSSREDEAGVLWNSNHGRKFKTVLKSYGVDLMGDCLCVSAVSCVTDSPNSYQINACRKHIVKTIEKYQPEIVFTVGYWALYSLIGHRYPDSISIDSFSKWRGWQIPDQDLNTVICPIWHPSFVSEGAMEAIWERDIYTALKSKFHKNKPVNIQIIEDLSVLSELSSKLVSIDYETTGIKPHASGHRVACASVAYTPNDCFVFEIPKSRKLRKPFTDLLNNPEIGKMAHNMKFEITWSEQRLGTAGKNWLWDSMLAAHVLDNRSGICGLKFLTYVYFGVIDYASEVSPYLRGADEKNANSMNKVLECLDSPYLRGKLLTYCGLDTIFQYRLALKQIKEIEPIWMEDYI